MRILIPVIAALGLSAACSNETVEKVKALADEACACGDAACADAVEKKYMDLVSEGQKRGSQDDRKEVEEAYNRMRECIAKARTAAPEPAEPGAAEGAEGAEGAAPGAGAAPEASK
ncbi:MAG TPA: hypothetical protein VKZ63_08430 [Kofleriaceae bacterium]|nr:hypothetical protein [Kofleriaceae bacterium]